MSETQPQTAVFARPVPLTRPPIIAGLVLVFILITAGFLAVLGTTVATTVTGTGVLLPGGVVYPALTPTSGQLSEITVTDTQQVGQGQQLATVITPTGEAVAVLAPITGTVLAAVPPAGAPVTTGEPIVMLVPQEPLQVQLRLPLDQASQVNIGMAAQVSALNSTVNTAGFAEGTVSAIAPTGLADLTDAASASAATVALTVSFAQDPITAAELPNTAVGDAVSVRILTGDQSVAALLRGSGS